MNRFQNNYQLFNTDLVFDALAGAFGDDIKSSMKEIYQTIDMLDTYEKKTAFMHTYWKLHEQLAQLKLTDSKEEEQV